MWTYIDKLHTIFRPLVHASAVHGGAEHSTWRAKDIENGQKQPKMRTFMVGANGVHIQLGPGHALELGPSPLCPSYLSDVHQTPLDLGIAGSPREPMIWV